MKERIIKIMEDNNLTPSAFADKLDIGRAVLSHILTGRNKASIDVIIRILETMETIDSDWLLFGKGEMYKQLNETSNTITGTSTVAKGYQSSLFEGVQQENVVNEAVKPLERASSVEESEQPLSHNTLSEEQVSAAITSPITNTIVKTVAKDISKIIIYYTDNTFQAFNPNSTSL